MVESTKNKKTLKKVNDDVVKPKATKNKEKIPKNGEKSSDKFDELKTKKTSSDVKVKKSEKLEKVVNPDKSEKIDKHLKSDKKEVKNHDMKKHEMSGKKHESEKHDKKSDDKEKKVKTEKVSEDEKTEKVEKKEGKKTKMLNSSIDSNHDKILHKPRKINKKCLLSIKERFSDISLLYKNFFHWNAHKIIIMVWSIILGFLSVLPIILIFFIYTFFSNVNVGQLIGGMFNGTLLNDFFGNIILMLIVAVFFVIYSYGNLLLLNVSNAYIDGKKLAYKKNDYFNFKKIVKYFNLSIINFLILLVPFVVFFVLMGILILVSGGLDSVNSIVSAGPINYFTILSFLFLILSLVSLIYLGYRTIFSYLVYLEESHVSKKVKVLACIKESFVKTKSIKSFFKFILVVIIFLVITLPIKFVGVVLDNNIKMLNDYSVYKSLNQEQKESVINSNNGYYYQSLEIEFKGFSDEKLEKIASKDEIYTILFSILSFLFLNGLFLMILASFYKRELQ